MLFRGLALAAALTALSPAAFALETVSVAIDEARAIELPAAATGVVLGNPGIAGVSVQHERLLFVTGRAYGSTNLIVVGRNGRPIYETRLSVVPDETSTVMVTQGGRGASASGSVRYDCATTCRRSPDIGEASDAHDVAVNQVSGHRSAATGGGGGGGAPMLPMPAPAN
jgi:Flp pilus assembly secretin CpaC